MSIPLIFLSLAMGAIVSIYFPMVARSAGILGSGPVANVPFFGIAFITSVVIAFSTGSRFSDLTRAFNLPPILLTAGVMSAGLIIGSSYLIPKIGLGAFFVLLVSGQVLASLTFGQLGLFGIPATDLTLGKVAGAALVIGGVWLVTFR